MISFRAITDAGQLTKTFQTANEAARAIQQALGVAVDGNLGSSTFAALRTRLAAATADKEGRVFGGFRRDGLLRRIEAAWSARSINAQALEAMILVAFGGEIPAQSTTVYAVALSPSSLVIPVGSVASTAPVVGGDLPAVAERERGWEGTKTGGVSTGTGDGPGNTGVDKGAGSTGGTGGNGARRETYDALADCRAMGGTEAECRQGQDDDIIAAPTILGMPRNVFIGVAAGVGGLVLILGGVAVVAAVRSGKRRSGEMSARMPSTMAPAPGMYPPGLMPSGWVHAGQR
jgi:hypothetical protein